MITVRSCTERSKERKWTLEIQAEIAAPRPPEGSPPTYLPFMAVWATGAVVSVISEQVVEKLDLQPTDQEIQHTVNGTREANLYTVNIRLPNEVLFEAVEVMDGIMEDDMLIGMDIIRESGFAVTHKHGRSVVSFQYPSDSEVDFTKHVPPNAIRVRKGKARAPNTDKGA